MTSLANLDMLPAGCSITVEADEDGTWFKEHGTGGGLVRFVAIDADGRQSRPSGWFDVADAPIHLSWQAFDFDD